MARRTSRRRGVVLLVILSLLVLFALLGITFVIVATQYKEGAQRQAAAERYGDDWGRQLDSAMYPVVRDTLDSVNPVRGQSMFNDLYGHDIYYGQANSAAATVAGGQMIEFTFTSFDKYGTGARPLPTEAGYFNGCVITFYRPAIALSGTNRLAGNSSRIIGYSADSGTYRLRIMRPTADDPNDLALQSGDLFLINGRAFAGTGAGFNPTTGKLDSRLGGTELALLPNRVGDSLTSLVGDATTPGYLYGGANEPWDAADLQTLFLSATIPDPTNAVGIRAGSQPGTYQIIPSFHRPALVAYHQQRGTWAANQQRIVFRPIPGVTAGPNFPAIDLVNGPWDVDNNGDTVADSIWMDLNMPVQTTSAGRRYKPLFAFLIVDLDGRLNVNDHGNEYHVTPLPVDANRYLADGSQTNAQPLKGAGVGPGEVRLGPDTTSTNMGFISLTSTQYAQLLAGSGAIPGRYGASPDSYAGATVAGAPLPIASDLRSATRFYWDPANIYNPAAAPTSYQSPNDFNGNHYRGVDARGMLNTDAPQNKTQDLRANSVYRSALPYDRRFTPAELERLLRYYDVDVAQLPDRLEKLGGIFAGGSPQASVNRQIATTHSAHMPIAYATPSPRILGQSGAEKRFRDPMQLLRARIGSAALSEAQILQLVDKDLYYGLQMNLNRPFGDGVDNNNPTNYIVDEQMPGEVGPQTTTAGFNGVNGEDIDGDGNTTTPDPDDQMFIRHQFAKHLYILASLAVDTGTTPNPQVQHQLAQWVANVIDYRDADSIMTPFEYDPNPFDGWTASCDGIINTGELFDGTRRLVWGLERPELLITETLAAHDRRTTDEADEDPVDMPKTMPGTTTETDMMKKDEDFDQKYLPQGAAFIEIYNPWQSTVERVPAEFYYDWVNGAWPGGVKLDQTTPDGNSPVWRMTVIKDASKQIDPDQLDPGQAQIDQNDRERVIYFTDPSGTVDLNENAGKIHFSNHQIAPLAGGRYAVIGSGESDGQNPPNYKTYFGFKTDETIGAATLLAETRQIVLTPSTDPTINQVQVLNNAHLDTPERTYSPMTTQPTIAVVVDQTTDGTAASPFRFSLSEPVDGYDIPATHMLGAPLGDGSGLRPIGPKPIDNPLDDTDERRNVFMKDGQHSQWRVVHLQRLANPLLPHNRVSNPYLTIDTIGSDLVVYNGLTAIAEPGVNGGPDDLFSSFQRGENPQPINPVRNLWQRSTVQNLPASATQADATHHLGFHLRHTLGFLNLKYHPYFTADVAAARKGDPEVGGANPHPFPWLAFNNRPFNNIYELMDVPATKSSQLTRDFRALDNTPNNPYNQDQPAYQYGHLINFFYEPAVVPPGQIAGMYRLFDYLRIPSKYVEADTMLRAASFNNGTLADHPFHPPYNWLSNWRDPGMVNINTIYSPQVWNAVLSGDPAVSNAFGTTYQAMADSRRGYGSGDELQRDSNVPTEFAGAFRPAGMGMMPGITGMAPTNDIDTTLLRGGGAGGLPLFANRTTDPYNHTGRHAAFRHNTLGRLSNTLTTRSNVFAVWVTVGYFEVDGNGTLGQELNADTGEIKRHRAFYMIDRSIPVGFEPGENHNVDRAILVRRYIE